MHRQHLVDILKRHLPTSCTVHFNKRLTKYDKLSAGSCILHFADDSTETADVLIGADGVRSSVRKTLFDTIDPGVIDLSQARHYKDASWSGTLIYRATFPVEKLSKIDPNHILLKGFVVVSPPKIVMFVTNNFSFRSSAGRERYKIVATADLSGCLLTKYIIAHCLVSGFTRNANQCLVICF